MRLTIDNLEGMGEKDYTALMDAEAPPKIVRKLNEAPVMTARLVCTGANLKIAAGSKVRLYRHDGELWFSGYLDCAPMAEYAGQGMASGVYRLSLSATGEMTALDRGVLGEHAAMGGVTAGAAVAALAQEANATFDVAGVQDLAMAGTRTVETGERWSTVARGIADCARAVLGVKNRAIALTAVGSVNRKLTDGDADFSPYGLKVVAGAPGANDVTVVGGTEPAMYVRDCFTATGKQQAFAMSRLPFKLQSVTQVEDDFHGVALDATKWKNDFPGALTFTQAGVSCDGPVALCFRDRLELGGLIILEQTGIDYREGQGVVGGVFCGGLALNDCMAGVMLNDGQVRAVINGVVNEPLKQLSSDKRYEFRTLIFHPEPIRAGQVYSSSAHNGADARTSQVWFGTTRIVLTMRELDAATVSAPQVVLFDGTLENVPAYGDYLPLWGLDLACTLGHASAKSEGAVWVQSAAPGQPWRTRIVGDIAAGAECYFTSTPELHFSSLAQPVAGEQIEVFYRARGLACGRVVDSASVEALRNGEDSGTRAMVVHVDSAPPRTSLDCEQAARALLDDLTQTPYSGEYETAMEFIPAGANDVQPGEQWEISLGELGAECAVILRDVEIEFQGICDAHARVKVRFANEAAEPIAVRFGRRKLNGLLSVVSSDQQEDVSARPAGLPDARVTNWGSGTVTVDAGADVLPGGGFEVRVEGDWGWGLAVDRNLVGRFTTRSFTLPRTAAMQEFYLRQFDGGSPVKYSTYSTILHLDA